MTMEKKGNTHDAQILRLFSGGFKGDLRHDLQRNFDCARGVKKRATLKMNGDAVRTITRTLHRAEHASQFSDAFDKCIGYLAKHHLK